MVLLLPACKQANGAHQRQLCKAELAHLSECKHDGVSEVIGTYGMTKMDARSKYEFLSAFDFVLWIGPVGWL